MLKVLFKIIWIDIHETRNIASAKVRECGAFLVVCTVFILLGAVLCGGIFGALNLIVAAGDPITVRELSHVLISIVGLLWIVLSLQFDFHRLNYRHLSNFILLPWSITQIYGAAVARALFDKLFVFFGGILIWWYLYIELPSSAFQIVVTILSLFLLGLVVVSWINVFRLIIEYSSHGKFWKWIYNGLAWVLFLGANVISIYSRTDVDLGWEITRLLSAGKLSIFLVGTPPGLFAEILFSSNKGKFLITSLCFVSLFMYAGVGIKVGSLLVGNALEKTGGKLSPLESSLRRYGLLGRARKWVESIVPEKHIPIFVQELAYLMRWKRVRFLLVAMVFLLVSFLFSVSQKAPMLLGVCPLFFFMAKFMNCFLNKDGTASAHYYLYPLRYEDIIVSKNIALLIFQYTVTIPFAIVGLVMVWRLVSLQEILCLVITIFFWPVFLMATGNLVAVTSQRKIVRAFSVISTPETTTTGMVITGCVLISGLTAIALMYSIPKFVLQSENTAVILFFHFAIVASVYLKWSIARAGTHMEKRREIILSKLGIF